MSGALEESGEQMETTNRTWRKRECMDGGEVRLTQECYNTRKQPHQGAGNGVVFRITGHKGISGNKISDDFARLSMGLQYRNREPAVGIFYTQIKEFLQLWDRNKAWIEAKGCRQVKVLINEKQPNRRTTINGGKWHQILFDKQRSD